MCSVEHILYDQSTGKGDQQAENVIILNRSRVALQKCSAPISCSSLLIRY